MIDENFTKTSSTAFDFPPIDPLDSKYSKNQIKQEVFEDFTKCENKSKLSREDQAAIIKEEIAMKRNKIMQWLHY